jgi:hypothetical protein
MACAVSSPQRQRRQVPSMLADASQRPSGLMSTHGTLCPCPRSRCSAIPAAGAATGTTRSSWSLLLTTTRPAASCTATPHVDTPCLPCRARQIRDPCNACGSLAGSLVRELEEHAVGLIGGHDGHAAAVVDDHTHLRPAQAACAQRGNVLRAKGSVSPGDTAAPQRGAPRTPSTVSLVGGEQRRTAPSTASAVYAHRSGPAATNTTRPLGETAIAFMPWSHILLEDTHHIWGLCAAAYVPRGRAGHHPAAGAGARAPLGAPPQR